MFFKQSTILYECLGCILTISLLKFFLLFATKKQIFLGLILTFLTGLTVGTGVAGPMINRVIPFTDPCKWVKYFWPASQEEITAVQEFVRTKASILQKVRRVV